MQKLLLVQRRASIHHTGGGSIVGSPQVVRVLTHNMDRPLMLVFNAKEEEVVPPAAPNLLPDNVMATFDE